jgi:hypothetical protein
MNKVAIAFMCLDKVEQSAKTLPPLVETPHVDTFIIDGSKTVAGFDCYKSLLKRDNVVEVHQHIGGGPDAAVAYAYTMMLAHPNEYDFVGIHEQDVLLEPDWYRRTMDLFWVGYKTGLEVGAVSARAYEDRILVQRDDYALMHNLGFGHQILTRAAATIWLKHWRTHHAWENRRLFAQLTNIDIGRYWFCRHNDQPIGSDWGVERVLASHGLASLALTPTACVDMIDNPLQQQGLTLVRSSVDMLRNDLAFSRYIATTAAIRANTWVPDRPIRQRGQDGTQLIFPHQVRCLGATYSTADWCLQASQGWGPFLWKAKRPGAYVVLPLVGEVQLLVAPPADKNGMVEVSTGDGAFFQTTLPPDPNGTISSIAIKGDCAFRDVKLTMLTEGLSFCGVRCRWDQPVLPAAGGFDHSVLPPVG